MVWDFSGDGAMWSGSHSCFCLTVVEVRKATSVGKFFPNLTEVRKNWEYWSSWNQWYEFHIDLIYNFLFINFYSIVLMRIFKNKKCQKLYFYFTR